MAVSQAIGRVPALILCDNALVPIQLRGGVEVAAEAELQVHLQLQCCVVTAEVLTLELHEEIRLAQMDDYGAATLRALQISTGLHMHLRRVKCRREWGYLKGRL